MLTEWAYWGFFILAASAIVAKRYSSAWNSGLWIAAWIVFAVAFYSWFFQGMPLRLSN